MASSQFIFHFHAGHADGNATMKELLGGKGANLAEMANSGLPVPPGFTISTAVCSEYKDGTDLPPMLQEQLTGAMTRLEKNIGKKFGDPVNPLLVSVRSGAAVSMPGMMDTVLNLGLNDEILQAEIARHPDRARFMYDSYRRFQSMFSDVVMGIPRKSYDEAIEKAKHDSGVETDAELSAEQLSKLCDLYKKLYQDHTKHSFPQTAREQLELAISAVFRSWHNPRAITYRRLNEITNLLGTAVNVQAMVFGNLNNESATGVAFSRDPSTGEKKIWGEWLQNAQGEDVVAGIRTPHQLSKEASMNWAKEQGIAEEVRKARHPSMEEMMPEVFKHFCEISYNLELHYTDLMDMEFTVEDRKLYMLQCRVGKRTVKAAVKCAVDMASEKLIDKDTAILRISPGTIDQLLHPHIDPKHKSEPLTKGLGASPGAACGRIVLDADTAVEEVKAGEKVILVRIETSPEDIEGMHVAEGMLTARGGMTSHAAVVARGMGKPCVAGCGAVNVLSDAEVMIAGKTFKKGDHITIDGTTGDVHEGMVPFILPELSEDFKTILKWCKEKKDMGVWANADTPEDAERASDFGAEGIGLCRTEHMFFGKDRIEMVRQMILAEDKKGRLKALACLLPMQRGDFEGILKCMGDRPVTIRLLDPPLHEFLPHDKPTQAELAKKMGVSPKVVADRVRGLNELNPMLGHRGVRLGMTYPEIYDMQVQAIMEAAVNLAKVGVSSRPEIMIPLVGKEEELILARKSAETVIDKVLSEAGKDCHVKCPPIGTMIEVPRAAITANQIAKHADFFSFGTNDLTQMTCGFSRDDAGTFLGAYLELGIYEKDPFSSIDQEGVGQLVKMGVRKGRHEKPKLKCGVCGEHGGDPASIFFFHKCQLDYVSCSPFRVVLAMLATAQAAIRAKQQKH